MAKPSVFLLVVLYGIGLVAANPLFAMGVFYAVFAVWILFAHFARKAATPEDRWIVRGLWAFITLWIAAVVPALVFASVLASILWFAGTAGTVFFGTVLLGRSIPGRTVSRGRSAFYRRLGLGSGCATSLLFLALLIIVLEGPMGVLFRGDVLLAYLPFLLLLVPTVVAIWAFAHLSRTGEAADGPAL